MPLFFAMPKKIVHYLELPSQRCLTCQKFNPSASRIFKECSEDCPGEEVQIVIKDSILDLVRRYREAEAKGDLKALQEILTKVLGLGDGFAYRFNQEIRKRSTNDNDQNGKN